ncbi:VanZ like protein [Hydrogenoanaerobacterium saccharovorans]|uniref:VanZ like family protein n=1 Tax=Hydrogenoanaerobacterium saccharovorans TaxID=474960 RepID=A0A1H8E442_9FIRM|nr:VanZ like protein [Hydrogenoanaerobacterium saccharovorans]SEN13558.1 VanZ like family protein [Hydrogenoanaerobacterium saccharovorans]
MNTITNEKHQKYTKILWALFLIYIIVVLIALFIIKNLEHRILYDYFDNSILDGQPNRSYLQLFNLFPMKSISKLLNSVYDHTYPIRILRNTLIRPIIGFLPCGFFNYLLFPKKRFVTTYGIFLLALCTIFIIRVFLLIGFFNIDKILLCSLGYVIGYKIAHWIKLLGNLLLTKIIK